MLRLLTIKKEERGCQQIFDIGCRLYHIPIADHDEPAAVDRFYQPEYVGVSRIFRDENDRWAYHHVTHLRRMRNVVPIQIFEGMTPFPVSGERARLGGFGEVH